VRGLKKILLWPASRDRTPRRPRSASPMQQRSPTMRTTIPSRGNFTNDCIAVAEALYGQAKTLSKRTKQIIPREFTRVTSNLDESCGEEDFDKARISIDWMNTCLENYTKDYSLGFCTRNKTYFCAINPRSDACLQSHRKNRNCRVSKMNKLSPAKKRRAMCLATMSLFRPISVPWERQRRRCQNLVSCFLGRSALTPDSDEVFRLL
jgi:hypothetical protein